MYRSFLLASVCCFLFPSGSYAAVSISEIAWMGSAASANYEWIELHNDAATAVDVTGWQLVDDANLEIDLVGIIPAESYVVLERTSDASAPGTAFLIYTGALVNTGVTLRLTDGAGSLVDQVAGGEDWGQVGGDNVTKETAQYTSQGWVTAAATPGESLSKAAITPEEVVITGGSSVAKSVAKIPTKLVLPGVTLELQIVAPDTVYVNQLVSFRAVPDGVGEVIEASLEYEWNFGDGSAGVTKETKHVFTYPGTYLVTVYGGYKRQEQIARHEITVLPVALSLTQNRAGDLQVHNDSQYEVDLSGYEVRGENSFVFPPRTILLARQSITLPLQKLSESKNRLFAVYDAKGVLIVKLAPDQYKNSPHETSVSEAVAYITPADTEPVQIASSDTVTPSSLIPLPISGSTKVEEVVPTDEQIQSSALIPHAQAATFESAVRVAERTDIWNVGLIGVLIIAVLGVLLVPRRNEDE